MPMFCVAAPSLPQKPDSVWNQDIAPGKSFVNPPPDKLNPIFTAKFISCTKKENVFCLLRPRAEYLSIKIWNCLSASTDFFLNCLACSIQIFLKSIRMRILRFLRHNIVLSEEKILKLSLDRSSQSRFWNWRENARQTTFFIHPCVQQIHTLSVWSGILQWCGLLWCDQVPLSLFNTHNAMIWSCSNLNTKYFIPPHPAPLQRPKNLISSGWHPKIFRTKNA